MEKLVIIGSGPAGLTAAIYAARGNLQPIVVAGRAAGGQLMLTTDVDDFPGFPEGIQGPDLMINMRAQAARFEARFIDEDVLEVDFSKQPFVIKTETQTIETQAVILATGATAKWLGIDSEKQFIGKGVSACAVCDGLFFKNKDVMVVGGGDTAMREAQHLAKHCKTVTVVHRRGELRAQSALEELVRSKPNVKFMLNSAIDKFIGQDKLEAVDIKDTQSGTISKVEIDGVFVAIGHSPSTGFLKGQVELDEQGYIVVTNEVNTSVKGIYVAGDVADHRYRQAVTAAGAGCKAALDVEEYLEHQQLPTT